MFILFSSLAYITGATTGSAPSGGGDGAFNRNDRRKRSPGARRTPQGQNQDGMNRGRTSLRLGNSGRRQRRSNSRGSLRKRDRTAQREAKAEAAEERRTIYLPEYVTYFQRKHYVIPRINICSHLV